MTDSTLNLPPSSACGTHRTVGAKLTIDPALLPSGVAAWVIDVGCGDGRHVAEAARRGCRAVGLDYDAAELRAARSRLGAAICFVAADAAHLPFRAAAFDAAICTETLEHLPDDTGAIAEIARVLRPGALLLGAVPSHFTELVYWRLSRGYWDTAGGHVRIYRPRELAAKLARAGLRMQSMRYLHFIDSLFWLRYCLTDFLRPRVPRTAYEQAIALAVAQEYQPPSWRRRLRAAIPRSRLVRAIDAAGAFVWPKSFAFVAEKPVRAGEYVGAPPHTSACEPAARMDHTGAEAGGSP